MDTKYKIIYDEIIKKLDLLQIKEKDIAVKPKTLKEAEDKIRFEYEKKELYEQKEILERYFKRVEYKEKVEKKHENFFWNSEE